MDCFVEGGIIMLTREQNANGGPKMKRTEVVRLTNMCMVYDDNKILVQDKLNDDFRGITFPGGHVEMGEPFTDAVIREVYEETGLTIKSPELCGVKDWMNKDGSRYVVLLYKTNQFSGTLKSSGEGDVFWLGKEKFGGKKLAPDMDALFRVFLDDSLSEFRYEKKDGNWEYCLK